VRRLTNLVAIVTSAVIASLIFAFAVAGCGSSEPGAETGTRSAAVSRASSLFAATTDPGGFRSGGPEILKCALPAGPCQQHVALSKATGSGSIEYSTGRVLFRASYGSGTGARLFSCSADTADSCATVADKDVLYGPTASGGRVYFTVRTSDLSRPLLYSCDAATVRALSDCSSVTVPRLWGLEAIGDDTVVGWDNDADVILACNATSGACREFGRPPMQSVTMTYLPPFKRLYLGFSNSRFGQDANGYYPMWSCPVPEGGCSRLNSLGAASGSFTGIGDTLYVGAAGVMACDPVTPDRCRRFGGDSYIADVLGDTDQVIVGTSEVFGEGSTVEGGIYRRPVDGGGGGAIRPHALRGITSLASNASGP